jgi:flavin-dependent dehydrogenase
MDSTVFVQVETLSPDTVTELSSIGMDSSRLTETGLRSYGIATRWHGLQIKYHSHILNPFGSCSFHVDRQKFHYLLGRHAVASGVARRAAKVTGFAWNRGNWNISLSSSTQQLLARFIVDSTGRAAKIAVALGQIRRRGDALCVVASSLPTASTERSLEVEAASYGWWYRTPCAGGTSVNALITDTDLARRGGLNRPNRWFELLQGTRFRLPEQASPRRLMTYRCESSWLDSPCGSNWIAVGDASIAFDPLTGNGVGAALRGGRTAAEMLRNGLDPASQSRYREEHRRTIDTYTRALAAHYGLNRRWASDEFWRRRLPNP